MDDFALAGDGVPAAVGLPFSVNVLANDFLGDPPATILASSFEPGGACTGLSFDEATGLFSGTPTTLGFCGFVYVIENPAGRSDTGVIVDVVPLAAPVAANNFFVQTVAGEPFSLNVLTDDQLGIPPATITSHTFSSDGACGGMSFDPATGLLSGAPLGLGTPTGDDCDFDYTLSNLVGSDSASVAVTVFPAPIAPAANADTQQRTAGLNFALGVLFNDFLGFPQATIASHTFDAATPGCSGLTFNATIGLVNGPANAGVSCSFDYTVSNTTGSSTATVLLETVAPLTGSFATTSTTTTPPTTTSTTTSTATTTTTSTTTSSTTTSTLSP